MYKNANERRTKMNRFDIDKKMLYKENVGIIQQKDRGNMTYQELFNRTLTKIRYATSGALLDNEPLMKAIVKIMYDFSDDLKANNLILDKGQENYGKFNK